MSKSDDPERLLAEALRAQAVSTPVTMPPLPVVLTEAAGKDVTGKDVAEKDKAPAVTTAEESEPAVEDEDGADEPAEAAAAPVVEEKAAEEPVAAAEPVAEEPPAEAAPSPKFDSDHPFTEEMVLRELSSGPMTGELATIRINNAQQQYDTERFSPLENLYGPVGNGPGFGLISGSEVGSTVGPPVGEFDHLRPPPPATAATTAVPTTRMRAERGQVPGWLILLFALVLGLAGGAVAGLLSML